MTDDLFAPSPELQAEIDEGLDDLRKGRKNEGWTSKKGVILSKREQRTFPVATPALSQSAYVVPGDYAAVMAAMLHGKYGKE